MLVWDPSQPLPDQVADAFAVLYDWLNGEPEPYLLIENSPRQLTLWQENETLELQKLVAASGWETPGRMLDTLLKAAEVGGEQLVAEVFRCVIAIDRGLRTYHPQYHKDLPDDDLVDLYKYWFHYGCYNTDAMVGYVLPKWTSIFREETTLARHCQHLVRVSIDRNQLSVISRGHSSYRSRATDNPSVVIVPFLYGLDDATFSPVEVNEGHFFEIHHSADNPSHLEQRIRSAVEAIRELGATIAIFPELVLNQRLLDVLKASLKHTLTPSSTLDWVIAGTVGPITGEVPFQVANMAVVLNGIGQVVSGETADGQYIRWEQPKRHRYMMSAEEQRRYGLVSCFGADGDECDRQEAIAVGSHRIVFDDPSGRYTILICEDWGKDVAACADIRQFVPRVVFVIVMDGPQMEHRWAAVRSRDIVYNTGAMVVLANSLLLPNLPDSLDYMERTHGIANPLPGDQQPVGRLYGPPEAVPEDSKKPHQHYFYVRALPDPAVNQSLISDKLHLPLKH